jgi:hypothetical protein
MPSADVLRKFWTWTRHYENKWLTRADQTEAVMVRTYITRFSAKGPAGDIVGGLWLVGLLVGLMHLPALVS